MALGQETKLFLNTRKILNWIPFRYAPLWLVRSLDLYGYTTSAPVKKVQDITISGPHGEIPLRIYTPLGAGPFPVMIAFHGGGWVIGSVEHYDGFCKEMCSFANMVVVSVGYRRAPEHKFPVPLEDCYAAVCWAEKNSKDYNGDPDKLVVAGESAGGNLGAAVALMARDKQGPKISLQLLMYPVTDAACDTPSHKEFATGYLVRSDDVRYSWDLYLRNKADQDNPYAFILRANVEGLSPVLVVLAEFDPLRDEGYAYAEKLKQAGVNTMVMMYPTIHGFLNVTQRLSIGKKGIADIVRYLKKFFSS